MSNILQQTVYQIANALLWPVILLLLFSVLHTAYVLGETLVEAWQRRGRAVRITDLSKPPSSMAARRGIAEFVKQRAADPEASPWLLADRTEAALTRRIDRARLWVRLGPALGLAATLIPLGPALTALAVNDLKALADGLILAFGATVLGLLSGGVSWVLATTIERWYRLDLSELRSAIEVAS